MLHSYEISPEHWVQFCDDFSHEHVDWPVTIEVLLPEAGPQYMARDLPLEGLSLDTKGTRPSSLEVSAGDSPERHVAHTVDLPLHIWLAEDGRTRGTVKIEPATGPVVLVHYHQPA